MCKCPHFCCVMQCFCIVATIWWLLFGPCLFKSFSIRDYRWKGAFCFIKTIQFVIQKCITWLKKSGKGKQTWEKTCIESRLRPRKLNTLMKTRYIFGSFFVYFLVFWNSSSVRFRGLMCFLLLWFQSQICQLNSIVPRCVDFS
jgi:hypothetical protein